MSIRNKTVSWYIFISLIIFILFKKKIDQILLALIVKPIMSYVTPASWIFDIIITLMCIVIGFLFIKKMNRGVSIPIYWFYITLTYLIVYSIYRITDFPFSFTPFSFSDNIKLLDLITLFPFALCLINLAFIRSKIDIKEQEQLGFDIDEPIIINKSNDILNRLKYIKNLAKIIRNTKAENGSFPIGVVSPWGSGKTTFLNSLREELNVNDFITIELDAWKCNSSDQIIETFFKLLKQKLKPFSFSINNKIIEYTNNLIRESKNKFLKSITEIFLSNESLEEQYKNINDEIKRINKKIIVLIDDIDRLNKKEIYEVIRLIRNTANFSNVFFVVAYDRNYILNAIEEINSYQSHIFLEKIFQVEFSLPSIEKNVLENQIGYKFSRFISTKSGEAYNELKKSDLSFRLSKTDLTDYYISNMRDVVRFVNSFRTNYELVKDEIYFPDFYNLQLIKFKHPEIFSQFFRNKNLFLRAASKENYYPQTPQTYALNLKETINDNIPKKEFTLNLYLKNQKDIYKIDDNEIETLIKSFSSIFQQHDDTEIRGKAFLTVVKPSMFDRYFRLGIEGRLSEMEFSKARELGIEDFIKKINDWSADNVLLNEVIERVEEIEDFDNQEDFEKIIKTIFYLGELTFYRIPNLENKLNNYENKLANQFYSGNSQKLKKFILGLFEEAKTPFVFASNFIKYLINRYSEPEFFILSKKELNSLSISYLRNYCSANEKLDRNTWNLFWNCQQVNLIPSGGTSYTRNKVIPQEAKDILKDFIMNKDFDGFLFSVRHPDGFHPNRFKISDSALNLFEDWPSFENILKSQSEERWIYLKEFKTFFEAIKEKNFLEYIDFKFEAMPVDEIRR